MFKLTKLITLEPNAAAAERKRVEDTLQAATRADARVRLAMLQPTLEGTYHGGDYIWHVQFAHEEDYRTTLRDRRWRNAVDRMLESEVISHVDSVAYHAGACAIPEPGMSNGVYRTLFISVRAAVAEARIKQFEHEMCEMPHYIQAIRNWGFSRVTEASGARLWTHVWEQDFCRVADITGPYLMHPFHWSFIDRWYDHECPDWIVDTSLCHTFCHFEHSVFR
jgi:hypothetical protein